MIWLLENLALRQQLLVLSRSSRRARLKPGDRLFWSWLARRLISWRSTITLVQPDTVIRWHRTAWRRYWTWKSRHRGPGCPRLAPELRALIQRIARENPRWGSVRIRGELTNLLPEQMPARLAALCKPKLLIIDEMGYLPFDRPAANFLFQLVGRRYERGSIMLTSNKTYGEWGDIFSDQVLAAAILDRLLHHSVTISIRGESYRLKDKRKGGVFQAEEVRAQI